jgi:hypothetical protein
MRNKPFFYKLPTVVFCYSSRKWFKTYGKKREAEWTLEPIQQRQQNMTVSD